MKKINSVNIIGMCLQGPHWQQINIDLDIGMHGAVLVTRQCLNKCWHSSLSLNEFSFIPLYHDTLCRCVFVCIHTMFTNVTLASDFICMLLLFIPFKHLLLCVYYITFTCVYYLCIYYITLLVCYISLCIYRFIYWKSGTSDHFGANVTCFTMCRL